MLPIELLRWGSASHEDMLTDAAAHVLAEKGAAGLTLRSVADRLRVSPPRVSQMTTRDQLPYVVTARFAQRWAQWIEYRRWREGALALLPEETAQLSAFRAWLALGELARHRADVREVVEMARSRERRAMTDLPDTELTGREIDLVLATADGLRMAVCRDGDGDPAAVPAARFTLTGLLDLLGHATAAVRDLPA